MMEVPKTIPRFVWFLIAAIAIGLAILYAPEIRAIIQTFDQAAVEALVLQVGPFGPIAIVGLMTLAIVASPIPSAPIALAAGLLYGHLWGGLLVIVGAEAGALIAFGLARKIGKSHVERWLGERISQRLLGSQNALMLTVFVSRLLPFVSFDLISYAAGLSRITTFRFAVATLAGIVPASFFLAHLGAEARDGNALGLWIALGLGAASVMGIAIFGRTKASAAKTPCTTRSAEEESAR